jgi:hypothetical protein
MSGVFGAAERISMPSTQAQQATRTAQPLSQTSDAETSDAARKNRRRAASILTRGWGKPKLSEEGMLGL